MLRGDLAHGIEELLGLGAGADHEDRARPIAGANEDVASTGRAVEEVPLSEGPLLLFDDQRALPESTRNASRAFSE